MMTENIILYKSLHLNDARELKHYCIVERILSDFNKGLFLMLLFFY